MHYKVRKCCLLHANGLPALASSSKRCHRVASSIAPAGKEEPSRAKTKGLKDASRQAKYRSLLAEIARGLLRSLRPASEGLQWHSSKQGRCQGPWGDLVLHHISFDTTRRTIPIPMFRQAFAKINWNTYPYGNIIIYICSSMPCKGNGAYICFLSS